MNIRYFLATLLSVTVLLIAPGYALAHASLHHSEPGADAVVSVSPPSVRLWFSKPLEPSFSTVRVVDQAGKQVDKGHAAVDGKDAKLLEVVLPDLPAGTYKVIWSIVALDGHKAKGDYTFTVK